MILVLRRRTGCAFMTITASVALYFLPRTMIISAAYRGSIFAVTIAKSRVNGDTVQTPGTSQYDVTSQRVL